MKYKNTFYSVARHALTITGGVLMMLGKTDAAAWEMIAGGALSLIGLAWGATDEHLAENPNKKTPRPPRLSGEKINL